jgi:hypothetical protein
LPRCHTSRRQSKLAKQHIDKGRYVLANIAIHLSVYSEGTLLQQGRGFT